MSIADISAAKHRYPSTYGPGTHWATDEAWEILDVITPGVISDDIRFLLAGMIAGTLLRVANERGKDNA